MDGVFDLFHIGHLNAIKQCRDLGNKVIIGVCTDEDVRSYKREPIICEKDRLEIIKSIKYVDEVIFPAPLYLTKEFIDTHKIDLVVHSFSPSDPGMFLYDNISEICEFKEIEYTKTISTSDIIKKLKQL